LVRWVAAAFFVIALALTLSWSCPGGGDLCSGSGELHPYGYEGLVVFSATLAVAILASVASAVLIFRHDGP
jgi:hypothetical protein